MNDSERLSRLRHDLSNPLSALLAETQLLLLNETEIDPQTRSSLREIEALEPVGDALEALDETSRRVLVAPRGQRFLAWRMWTLGLRRVFLEADRAWAQIAPSLQETA